MSINWLPLSHRKNISSVKVVYEPYNGQNYGGYYIVGSRKLVVVETEDIQASIAHEFRHHIQYELNTHPSVILGSVFNSKLPYKVAIAQYYKLYTHELDALLYEYKYAKNYINEWWLKGLVYGNKGDCKWLL